jgi:hypothetical protein
MLEMFENDLPFEIQCKNWLKYFNSILYKCFKKVRIVSNKKKEMNGNKNLLVERSKLLKEGKAGFIDEDLKIKIEKRIGEIEEEIGDEVLEENIKEIVETLQTLGGDDNSVHGDRRNQIWKLLKNKYPKNAPAIPVGKKDKSGNIITNHI